MVSSFIKSLAIAIIFICSLIVTSEAEHYVFNFEKNMESWSSFRGSWKWSDRDSLPNTLPDGSNDEGFAVMDNEYNSDELYTPYFNVQQGGRFTMNFFLRSRYAESANMYVELLQEGQPKQIFLDLKQYASPQSDSWFTVSALMPPILNPARLAIFCYNGEKAQEGLLLYGCAIDDIVVDIHNDATTVRPTTDSMSSFTSTTTKEITSTPANTLQPTTSFITSSPTDISTDAFTDPHTDCSHAPTTNLPTHLPTDSQTNLPTDAATDTPTDITTSPTSYASELTTGGATMNPTDAQTDSPTFVSTEGSTVTLATAGVTSEVTIATTEDPVRPSTDITTEASIDFTTYPATSEGLTDITTEAPSEFTTYPTKTEGLTDITTEVHSISSTYPATTEGPTDVTTEADPDVTTYFPTTEGQTDITTEAQPDVTTFFTTTEGLTVDTTTMYPEVTTDSCTTDGPLEPLIFDFQDSQQGWTASHMNGAIWRRVELDTSDLPVGYPPAGPWVMQIDPSSIFAGTVLAHSPQLEVASSSLTVQVTFWMDGTTELPSQLKLRRCYGYNLYDETPLINLDAFGDQVNHYWVVYMGSLDHLTHGQPFTLALEGSLGGDNNNSVVVNRVTVSGARLSHTQPQQQLFDFENGLTGWSVGNMAGGRWVLQNWTEIDPAWGVPRPSQGDNVLWVDRFDIHSGVITVESPSLTLLPGQRKKLHLKFWVRGSVVHPAVIRLRQKSVSGHYDPLPFLILAPYGDIDHPGWILLDREYQIPVDLDEPNFQVVVEADLGSDPRNMAAIDDLTIITEYIGI